MNKEKRIITLISISIVLLLGALIYFQPSFFSEWVIKLEDETYDREVRHFYKPLSSKPSVAIVAIDDESISKEGKWPWHRSKMGKLADELHRLGASTIAFDMTFSEPDINPVDAILTKIDNPSLAKELEEIKPQFDTDPLFAKALQESKPVLGFLFTSEKRKEGMLPKPLLRLSKENTPLLSMNGFIGNLPLFQEKSSSGGFLNTTIDADGILRFSPLLIRYEEKVYPSLALDAVKQFLSLPLGPIVTGQIGGASTIESIRLGDLSIPLDPWGRILIPFRGPPHSFPYISATRLLQGDVKREEVEGKLIFIGMSATASSDLVATAISPTFPGVEVQATIASGIIDHYLPYKPNWGRGSALLFVMVLGIGAAILFPHVKTVMAFAISALIVLLLHGLNYWIWSRHSIVLSFFFPMPTLITLFILDLLTAYIGDIRRSKNRKID
jgi:adenylate cyclase